MLKKYLIILLCAAALLTSCAENQTDNDDPNAPHKHTSDSWETREQIKSIVLDEFKKVKDAPVAE